MRRRIWGVLGRSGKNLMVGLQSWLCRYERRIAVAAMILSVIALFTLKLNRNLAPIPCVVFAVAVYRLKKRRSLALIAWLIMLLVGYYATAGYIILEEKVCSSPLKPLPDVNAIVLLGGDYIRIHSDDKCFGVTVCFYVSDGDMCVIAAHSCKTIPGSVVKTLVSPFSDSGSEAPDRCPGSDPNASSARVMLDSDYGVVLSDMEPPGRNPEELPVGGPDDIHVGEEALLYTASAGVSPVEIKGFSMVGGRHMVIAQLIGSNLRIKSGNSGSPVVQRGKIIGFLAGTYAMPYRGPRLVVLRPACDVYSELIGNPEHGIMEH